VAQQAKASAARAEAEAARPGEGQFYAAPRLAYHPFPHSFLCLSYAFGPSGGSGGTRRPERARHGKGASAAARPRSSKARRPSSCRPLRCTMRSSRWRSWTRPTPFAPRLMPLALKRDSATRQIRALRGALRPRARRDRRCNLSRRSAGFSTQAIS
jgi:hypothetical protein